MKARARHYAKNPGGKGRSPQQADYARRLDALVAAGVYTGYREEAVTLKLADGCTFRVDFWVDRPDREIECHEVKGRMEADAAIKMKWAPKEWPHFHWKIAHGRTVRAKKSGRSYWSDPIRHGWEVDDVTFGGGESDAR